MVKRYDLNDSRSGAFMDEREDGEFVRFEEIAALTVKVAEWDKILRSSVPDEHKGCTSPVGAVQNYIAELEARGDALHMLLLNIGHKSHEYATMDRYTAQDRDTWCWTLRRWCNEFEIEDYLRERAEYIANGTVKPGVYDASHPLADTPRKLVIHTADGVVEGGAMPEPTPHSFFLEDAAEQPLADGDRP